ncbi:MAG: TonB-dependent receptor [Rhodospirillaceae bacterium]|nr:TonB-dependent receptor [Rhodospirillaceae bacterium]
MLKKYLATSVAAFTAFVIAPDMSFNTTQAQTIALEEIVVTARRRAESLQDVPLSITAFTADQIDRAGFKNLEDISMQTTGMQFNNDLAGNRPGRLNANIRFRGVEGSEFSTLQTASLFIDGVFALQGAQSIALMDLERVEIIKGPQSATFSRNSFAGAINYITSTPSLDEYSGKVMFDAGTHGNFEVQTSFEGPLIENKLAFRVAGRLYQRGSYYTATDGTNLGEQGSDSISAQLYAQPSENFTLKLRAFYQEDSDGPEAVAFLKGRLNDSCSGLSQPGLDSDRNPITLNPTLFKCGKLPGPGDKGAPLVTSNGSLFPQILATTGPNIVADRLLNGGQVPGVPQIDGFGLVREIKRLSLTGDYEMDNGVVITGTASYNENASNGLRDWDMTDVEAWYVTNPQAGEDYGVDIRAASSSEGRLRWVAGANYYNQDYLTSAGGGTLVFTCANFGALFGIGSNCDSPGFFPVSVDGGDTVDVWGVYGSVSYDITEQFTLDVEMRYQQDERGDGVGTFFNTFKNWLPRVSASYEVADDVKVYATASRGILPGVINSNLVNCQTIVYTVPFTDPRTGLPSTQSECEQFKSALGDKYSLLTADQKLDSLEAGMKSTWMDGRLLLNVAAYIQEWKNSPSSSFITIYRDDNQDGVPNVNPNFDSAATSGSSKYYGLEIESAFQISDEWSANLNLTFNENEFTTFTTATSSQQAVLGTTTVDGNRAGRFPKWSGNFSSSYTAPLTGDWEWFARGDITYMGKSLVGITNLAYLESYFLVNTRMGIQRENLRVEFYVKNLFNEDSWRGGQEFTDFSLIDAPGIFDFNKLGVILLPQDRRTVGLRSSITF